MVQENSKRLKLVREHTKVARYKSNIKKKSIMVCKSGEKDNISKKKKTLVVPQTTQVSTRTHKSATKTKRWICIQAIIQKNSIKPRKATGR